MAELTVQQIDLEGLEASFVAADEEGDSFFNDGRVFLHVKNGALASVTVTIDSVVLCDQGHDHDIQVEIPAFNDGEGTEDSGERLIGPFPKRFNDENNMVNVAYSDESDVTVAAIRL